MRICQVSSCFYPAGAYGGQANVAYEVAKRLAKRGHEITVYTTDAMDKGHRLDGGIKNIGGVKVFYFKNISNLLAWNQRITISPGMIPIVRNEIEDFDIIHIHGFRDFQSIVIHHYAQRYDIPYILQPHGSVPRLGKGVLKRCFDLIFGYRILKDSDKILVLNKTEGEQCKVMGVNENRIKIIPNGIDLSKYHNLPERGLFKERYNIKEDEKIILYLGRIHKSKGIELLVKAFAEVLKNVKDLKLVIVGTDDGYLPTLRALTNSLNISNSVLFTGFLTHEEKLLVYVDADVFVTPSFTGFPLTFLEAMACGVPIITTNKGDFIEGIDNEVGYVVQYDEKELKNALFKILTDDGLRAKFRRNCREKIREYDWDTIIDEVETLYMAIIKEAFGE